MARPRRMMNQINVVPYIDVMLVLLVIFMVAAPMLQTGSVDLPTVDHSSAPPDDPLRILVRENGDLSIRQGAQDEQAITRSNLVATLKERLSSKPDTAILIAGDRGVRYEKILDVLDEIKGLDIKRVGLETVRK